MMMLTRMAGRATTRILINKSFVSMVLILDGNSEHCAQMLSKWGISICLRRSGTSKESSNPSFPRKRLILLHTCALCSELPSYISTIVESIDEYDTKDYMLLKYNSIDFFSLL